MMFILLVAAILVIRFYPIAGLQRLQAGLVSWHGYVQGNERIDRGRLYLLLAVPVLALLLVLGLLKAIGWIWMIYLLSGLVLLASLGGTGLKESVAEFVADLKRDDIQAAYHDAAALNGNHHESEAQSWFQLHAETLEVVAHRFYGCYFPVIFWFVILGAPGALLYRTVALYQELAPAVDKDRLYRLRTILDWLPTRLFGVSLALVGNFQPVMTQLSQTVLDYTQAPAQVVTRYVRAAVLDSASPVDDAPGQEVFELEELPGLVDRALVTWIAVVGLLAVF